MNLSEIKHNSTWIQGYGATLGKPAGDLVVGDVMGWNYGSTSVVKEITKTTAKTISIKEELNGKLYDRTMKKNRIVAIINNGKFVVANVTKEDLRYVK